MNISTKEIQAVYDKIISKLYLEINSKLIENLPFYKLQIFEIQKILRKLQNIENAKIIDIGSGVGVVPLVLKELGYDVSCVDYAITTESIESLNNLIRNGIKVDFIQVGVEKLPYLDNNFDLAFVGNVIEHIPHYPRGFILEIKRILKKDGFLVIDTKNAVDIKTRIKMFFGISNWPYIEGIYDLEYNPFHHKEYTQNELSKLLELSGFNEIESFSHEVFLFKSLKKFKSFTYMGVSEERRSIFGKGFKFSNPYEYLRILLLFIVFLFPNLKSDIMSIGKK